MTINEFCTLGVSVFNMEKISFHGFHHIDCDLYGNNWQTFSCIRALLRERNFYRDETRRRGDKLDIIYRNGEFTIHLTFGG